MHGFILSVVANVAVAGALALLALIVTRTWRDPRLAHALWLLVLFKLVTPPLVQAPVPHSLLTSAHDIGQDHTDSTKRLPASVGLIGPRSAALAALPEPRDAASARPVLLPVVWLGGAIWLTGAMACLTLFLLRTLRFRKLLAASSEADGELLGDARRLASVIALASCPAIRVIDARIPPLVWSVGCRPVILLPLGVLARLDANQRETVLLHELAHIRRRDHWVRSFELLVMVLHWWNPIVWWTSRQIRQSEEECCDAWVVWALPECRRSYGQALLETVEFLTESRAVPAVIGNAFGGFLFKRRIEMILKRRMNPTMPRLMWVAMLLLGAAVLPVSTGMQAVAQAPGAPLAPLSDSSTGASSPVEQPKVNPYGVIRGPGGRIAEPVQKSHAEIERALAEADAITVMVGVRNVLLPLLESANVSRVAMAVFDATKDDDQTAIYLLGDSLLIATQQSNAEFIVTALVKVLFSADEGATSLGLISKDYPLTDKEAGPLASLLKAFGSKDVYVWAYDREKGTASISAPAEVHRRIAALLQLLRNDGGGIGFTSAEDDADPQPNEDTGATFDERAGREGSDFHFTPLTGKQIQEQRLRQEQLLRHQQQILHILSEKQRLRQEQEQLLRQEQQVLELLRQKNGEPNSP